MIIRFYDYTNIYYTDIVILTKYVTYTYPKKRERERENLYREQLYYLPIKPNIKK